MATPRNISNQEPQTIVPEVVIQRLPLYVRVLSQFLSSGHDVISSEQLGHQLQMTPAQIRKDLSYFGRFGKQGRGYDVAMLEGQLRTILGLDRTWNAAVIGMGRLGRAVVAYPGFAPEGFNIVSAFDSNDEDFPEVIVVDDEASDRLYVGCRNGRFYASDDGGENWETIDMGIDVLDLRSGVLAHA